MRNNKVLLIVLSGLYIALIYVVQIFSQSFGQLVTGSLVNTMLILAGATAGLIPGLCVAIISPILAAFNGIGPQNYLMLIFIILGNAVIVILTYFGFKNAGDFNKIKNYIFALIGIILGAVAKFLILWLGITKFALLIVKNLKPAQITKFTTMFSIPQLITALIGGAIALILAVPILKALKKIK